MAISYPLTFPTIKKPRRQRFITQSVNAVSRSPFTLSAQYFSHPGQLWRAEVELAPTPDIAVAETWISWLLSLNGRKGTFQMGDVHRQSARGTATSATLTGDAGSSSPTITMTGTLLAGDYFRINTGANAKLHKLVQDRSGSGVIEIWPALRGPISGGAISLTNTYGIWRLDSNEQEWSVDKLLYEPIIFNAVENLV